MHVPEAAPVIQKRQVVQLQNEVQHLFRPAGTGMGRHADSRDDTLLHRGEPTERHLFARHPVQTDDGANQQATRQAHHHIAQKHRRAERTEHRHTPAMARGGSGKNARWQDGSEGAAQSGTAHREILQPCGQQQQGGKRVTLRVQGCLFQPLPLLLCSQRGLCRPRAGGTAPRQCPTTEMQRQAAYPRFHIIQLPLKPHVSAHDSLLPQNHYEGIPNREFLLTQKGF